MARFCTPSQQLEGVCCSRSWPSRLVGGEADNDRSRVAEPVAWRSSRQATGDEPLPCPAALSVWVAEPRQANAGRVCLSW